MILALALCKMQNGASQLTYYGIISHDKLWIDLKAERVLTGVPRNTGSASASEVEELSAAFAATSFNKDWPTGDKKPWLLVSLSQLEMHHLAICLQGIGRVSGPTCFCWRKRAVGGDVFGRNAGICKCKGCHCYNWSLPRPLNFLNGNHGFELWWRSNTIH